ncbi:MAG: hypothetical protein A3G75_09860 [Verrucomicrobia bacterium RIFCSPLOWO2_12_FULL_64_8]|nr:MAG: hypothetical protein A3G75_09860 [Verrucomicrobia bacterium RIFCSPLOWO2_12_FULL_64_8]
MNTSTLLHPLRLPALAGFASGRPAPAVVVVPRIRSNLVLRRVAVSSIQRGAVGPFSDEKCRLLSK